MSKKLIFAAAGITVITVFLLAIIWEHGAERVVSSVTGVRYQGDFEEAERWRFILTSTAFAAIAVLIPSAVAMWFQQRLRDSYAALEFSRHRAEFLAKIDPLTGMSNRRVFVEVVDELTNDGIAQEAKVAILVLDLDKFKPINDVHGHSTGDAVLCVVADRLMALAGTGIWMCRLGGDEFAAAIDLSKAGQSAIELGEAVSATLAEPILIEGTEFTIGATTGAALYPTDGLDTASLLRSADLAMYVGKREARGDLLFFEPAMATEVREHAALESELRNAIARGEVRPHYQPLISLQHEAIDGFEVLARWYRPDGTITPPDQFIPVAEDTGLIVPMTFSVLRQACLDARSWPDHLNMAVNISPSQFSDRALPAQISRILSDTQFPASRIEVEITESALIGDIEAARANVAALKALGMHVALDDFGTGYSSLGHLREFPFDKVKIDRSFATSMLTSSKNRMIVEGIVDLCRGLGLVTTVEGVETEALLHSLTAMGCEFGQGYLFSKPMPAVEVAEFLEHFAANGEEGLKSVA